ncbi:BEL1-like homeodomain protein 9 [Apium graveolens]|uniref:BEL1-like homeodomain protein 9 n=1 Tax=Apium graveolens TaxID=4045 RepID=UPI003D7B14AC
MADQGFDSPYHVPQQSRRDKLRVGCSLDNTTNNHLHNNSLQPFYDPSSIMSSSDLLTCASFQHGVKEERMNLMTTYISSCSSSTSHNHLYMDPQPQPSFHINPNHIQDLNNSSNPNNYLASSQVRILDQSFNGVLSSGQGLSLSLSSQQNSAPLSLNLQRSYQQPYDLSRSSVPLGPFTGYASILKGSRFLKPAQQMLEEICDVDRGNFQSEKFSADACLLDPSPLDNLSRNDVSDDDPNRSKKSKLLCMLDEVYKRYRQYYQQMQAVVTSFETVAGLSTAAPFAHLALKAMSKHFRYLKNAITDQLQFTIKSYGQVTYGKDGMSRAENADSSIYGQKPVQNMGFIEHQPVWRPQRGLPERAVTVLRAWLFEHFLHPYPTDTDKLMLAKQTGLSRNQVSNWFINARVRLWKPMVEEIHNLETKQKPSQRDEQYADKTNNHLHAADSVPSENASTSSQRVHDLPTKRSRDDYSNNLMTAGEEPMNLLYGNAVRHQHIGVGMNGPVGTSGVSLTLGLQNNGIGMSEPFAMNAARRFGIEASNEGLVMGTFETQNRQFGRDYIGSQLLHDFVG